MFMELHRKGLRVSVLASEIVFLAEDKDGTCYFWLRRDKNFISVDESYDQVTRLWQAATTPENKA